MDVGRASYATRPEAYDSLLLVSAGRGLAGVCPHSQPQHIAFSFTMGIFWVRRNKVYRFQVSTVTQSCPTLCNPMDCHTPGFPVHHQFPELAQTNVHQVSDAIQPSHPLLFPSPVFSFSQHQDLFQ